MGGMGFLNLLPKLPDFAGAGLNYGVWRAQSKNYASQVRHLRRREYQDMVFSMKQAGLNPILAVGATPGHSAAMAGHGGSGDSGSAGVGTAVAANESARAANRNAKVSEVKAPSEIANLSMQRSLMAEDIKARVYNNEYTAASTARQRAETNKVLGETSNLMFSRALLEEQAKREGFSANKLDAERRRIEQDMSGRNGGNIVQDPIGYGTNAVRTGVEGLFNFGKTLYEMYTDRSSTTAKEANDNGR